MLDERQFPPPRPRVTAPDEVREGAAETASGRAPAGDPAAHRVDLPDGTGEWAVWRCACVRGAGFAVADVLRLGSPPVASAADRLRAAEDAAEQRRKAAAEALSAEIARAERSALDGLIKALQQIKKGKLADVSRLPAGAQSAVARWAAAEEERRRLDAEYLARFAAEEERRSGELQGVARDARFREAILWQNRAVLETGVDRMAAREAGGKLSSKRRQHERVVASYLQRFCTKNDTIGFFGPVGWASLGLEAEPIVVRHTAELLADRRVFFEGWCIDAVAAALCADQTLRPALAPRRGLFVRPDGQLVGRTARLRPELRRLLALCDGETPARRLARQLVAAGAFGDAAAVYAALSQLETAGLVTWGFDLPVVLEPERALERQLRLLSAGEPGDAALRKLGELLARRDAVSRAAGDVRALDAALRGLELCFTGLTGLHPTRGEGETYAGRTLVYEDCRRGTEVAFGGKVLAALGPPLGLALTSARWLTWAAAKLHRARFEEAYRRLRQATGSPRVSFASFCRIVLPTLFNARTGPVTQQLLPRFWQRWATVLDLQEGSARQLSYGSAELRPRVLAAFAAPGPGWTSARHHSPDLLIAAAGPEAIRSGDYRFVLGELHVAANTLSTNLFVAQHPSPEELVTAMERDVPEPCVFPTPPKTWRQAESDALLGVRLPSLSGRLSFGLAAAKDLYLEVSPAPPGLPRRQVLPVADLVVEPGEDGLQVVGPGGSRFDLLDFMQTTIKAQVAGAFKILPPRAHNPRITVDRLVLSRESWYLPAAGMDFAGAATPAQRFLAVRRWADRLGLPRLLFVKSPHERKPFFLDLLSPLSVEIFGSAVRRVREGSGESASHLGLSEMLPGPEESWLPDAAGRRYTSELRLVAFDRAPCSRP
jgi:hypothetical protein